MKELISCICPTYGRMPDYIHLLQESVYWFNAQTYQNKELVILNDCPEQRIICNVPNVRVINLSSRFKTLGEKYNALVEEAKGSIIVPWEDDDVSLPERLAQAEEKLRDGREYFNPQQSWYEDAGILHSDHKHGVCHNASAYRLELFKRSGGYACVSGSQDMDFDHKCKQYGTVAEPLKCKKEWTYIYRWSVSPYHLSGANDMQRLYDSIKVESGIVIITPAARIDYAYQTGKLLKQEKCQGKCLDRKCAKADRSEQV